MWIREVNLWLHRIHWLKGHLTYPKHWQVTLEEIHLAA